ncbi:MAG: c-type cytochrome [Bacteroidota bacterium]
MKREIRFLTYPLIILATGLFLVAFTLPQDKEYGGEWDIPEEYENMENPYADDASLNRVGKMLYTKHCKSCHGSKGEGDGPKAASMEVGIRDLASDEVQEQSDGVLYYQSIIGRDEMPNYEKKIPVEEDRWAVINFIRSLKK